MLIQLWASSENVLEKLLDSPLATEPNNAFLYSTPCMKHTDIDAHIGNYDLML